MPFKLPPRDVQDRVASVLGDEFWVDFTTSLDRVKLNSPPVNVTQWYRDPDDVVRVHRTQGGALFTQHGQALAQDWVARNAREADQVQRAAEAEHFFVRRYPSKPTVVHIAALSDEAWARSQLRLELEQRVRARLAGPVLVSREGR